MCVVAVIETSFPIIYYNISNIYTAHVRIVHIHTHITYCVHIPIRYRNNVQIYIYVLNRNVFIYCVCVCVSAYCTGASQTVRSFLREGCKESTLGAKSFDAIRTENDSAVSPVSRFKIIFIRDYLTKSIHIYKIVSSSTLGPVIYFLSTTAFTRVQNTSKYHGQDKMFKHIMLLL